MELWRTHTTFKSEAEAEAVARNSACLLLFGCSEVEWARIQAVLSGLDRLFNLDKAIRAARKREKNTRWRMNKLEQAERNRNSPKGQNPAPARYGAGKKKRG